MGIMSAYEQQKNIGSKTVDGIHIEVGKEKLLLIAYRGYGDLLFAIPVLDVLSRKYHIHLETSQQGAEIFKHDARIIGMSVTDITGITQEKLKRIEVRKTL